MKILTCLGVSLLRPLRRLAIYWANVFVRRLPATTFRSNQTEKQCKKDQ